MPPTSAALAELAPAKINLTLRVLGRRADGYHRLESLVAFASLHDRLTLAPGPALDLVVRGRTAQEASEGGDNLVLRAARRFAAIIPGSTAGRFVLTKNLPVAAGLGGGSSDAAASIRLLARANAIALDDDRLLEIAAGVGADVPVCLDPRTRIMAGIGERLSPPHAMPKLPAVLINPGVPVPTRAVFEALALKPEADDAPAEAVAAHGPVDTPELIETGVNDLQRPAVGIAPVITDVLEALRDASECRLARMSGSGATCFGLFPSSRAATMAAHELAARHPGWWVRATAIG